MQDAMAALFASGRIVDAILALVALEAVALLVWRRMRGHGPSASALLVNLASGAALMLAVRAALTGAAWTVVALFLLGLVALVAHGADLALRLRDTAASLGRRRGITDPGTSAKNGALHARH